MFNLKRLTEQRTQVAEQRRRIAYIRDRLLEPEIIEMQRDLPRTCRVQWENKDKLQDFQLLVMPEEGDYRGGSFIFDIHVPDEYNIKPPEVRCRTRIWHPNITEDGAVCLSLLRAHSIDGTGWSPTRNLKQVIFGINMLFNELMDKDDPLNVAAAQELERDRDAFRSRVRDYIQKYCPRSQR